MEEQWKDIQEFPNYEISNLGCVRHKISGRVLKQQDKLGYKRVHLYHNGTKKTLLVHRLVAQQFIQNTENKPTVNHIDMNPQNNCITNLEWATLSEQQQHNIKNKEPLEFGYGHARKGIIQYNLETLEKIQEFPSITLASEWLYNSGHAKFKEFNYNTLCSLRCKLLNCIKGKRKSVYGFGWIFKNETIENEEWREIPPEFVNNNANYYVSNMGRVKSPKNKIMNQNMYFESNTVNINKKTYYTHRLVAFAFIPNPENKLFVTHVDGNKRNNIVSNLSWKD